MTTLKVDWKQNHDTVMALARERMVYWRIEQVARWKAELSSASAHLELAEIKLREINKP